VDLGDYGRWLSRHGRSDGTVDRYTRTLSEYLFDPERIEKIVASPRASANYRRFLMAVLRSWAKFSHDDQLKDWLDVVKRPPPTPMSSREPLDFHTWDRVLQEIRGASYLTDAERAVAEIVAIRGIRCGDVVRLTRKQVELGASTDTLSYVGKGGRSLSCSSVPLRRPLVALNGLFVGSGIKAVRNLVSPLSRDSRASQETATRRIRRKMDLVADAVGVSREDLHPHKFRHTYATLYLQELEGDPEALPKLVQQMGWANLNTAANYLRRNRRPELDAVEARMHKKMRG